MTLLSVGRQRRVQAWSLVSSPLEGLVGVAQDAAPDQSIVYAVADLRVPADWQGSITVVMVSLHRIAADAPADGASQALHWPEVWGAPVTVADVAHSAGRSPVPAVPSSAEAANAHYWQTLAQGQGAAGWELAPTARAVPHAVGHGVLQPLPLALTFDDAVALLRPLAALVREQRAVALRAQPGTLSRQRRSLRWMRDCVLRLHGQLLTPQAALRFVAATCRHPGITELEAARSDHTLLQLAARQRQVPASFMWMLGDQIYADARAGLASSSSPIESLLPRYREAFGSAGFRQLARSLPLYMAMDDHEIADNWSRDDERLGTPRAVLTRNALSAYAAFQRAHGPAPLGPQGHDAAISYRGAAFLSLNTRVHRNRALGPRRHILEPGQWPVLEAWLLQEEALGAHAKFIATGSVLAPGLVQGLGWPSPRSTDNWQFAERDRQRLLDFIAERRIRNVVFLSGDYHCAASATIRFSHSPVSAYALVTPPLHAPLRFANVAASDVLAHETVPLAGGSAQIDAQAWNGDGWLECELEPSASGGQRLRASFTLRRFDVTRPDLWVTEWALA
jgi:hypothetical protein